MSRFYAASFTAAMTQLGRAEAALALVRDDHPNAIRELRDAVGGLVQAFDEPDACGFPISTALSAQLRRFQQRVNDDQAIRQFEAVTALSSEVQTNIITEMTQAFFLCIPAGRRALLEQPSPPFGPLVDSRFPEARRDISASGRCIALDESTAAVFHLMRTLEHGLREFGRIVDLPAPENAASENWNTIIERIEKQIRVLDTPPRTPEMRERIGHYSQAASQFRYFKDAWRNHVSHGRGYYDEAEAWRIWGYVRDFMQHVAVLA